LEFGSPVIVLKAWSCPAYGATRKRRVTIDDHVSVIEAKKLLLGCHTDLLVVRSAWFERFVTPELRKVVRRAIRE
jgi:hypothetical protein